MHTKWISEAHSFCFFGLNKIVLTGCCWSIMPDCRGCLRGILSLFLILIKLTLDTKLLSLHYSPPSTFIFSFSSSTFLKTTSTLIPLNLTILLIDTDKWILLINIKNKLYRLHLDIPLPYLKRRIKQIWPLLCMDIIIQIKQILLNLIS